MSQATTPRNASRPQLVRAAARLFRDKGYERTTVRDLAAAVGMQSGSLFYHFKNKGEILAEVMNEGVTAVLENTRQAANSTDDPRGRLVAMTTAHLETLHSDQQSSLSVMLYEWNSLPEAARANIIAQRNAYEALWHQALQAAMDAKLIKGDLKLLTRLWLGALNWTTQWFRDGGPLTTAQLAENTIEQFIPAA